MYLLRVSNKSYDSLQAKEEEEREYFMAFTNHFVVVVLRPSKHY